MLLCPPLPGIQVSPLAPLSWILLSGHTPDNHQDRLAKPLQGFQCCVCLHARYVCFLPLPFLLSPLLPAHPLTLPSFPTVEKVIQRARQQSHRQPRETTVIMHQPPPNTAYKVPCTNVNGTQLKTVDIFTYLGNNLYRSTKIDNEIANRIAKLSDACRISSGIDAVSTSAPKSRYKKLQSCLNCCIEQRPEWPTKNMHGSSTTSTSAAFAEY
ncbi:unnamed protein product [Schistocephalus solidus]|uniref:Uncharacterized protein n=1 Tax=Schistocephalus solidus TaxID=70667 RepID=A0A183SGM8_SCHSO|nr:unnamed protein product [Schistocephalus solidus]